MGRSTQQRCTSFVCARMLANEARQPLRVRFEHGAERRPGIDGGLEVVHLAGKGEPPRARE